MQSKLHQEVLAVLVKIREMTIARQLLWRAGHDGWLQAPIGDREICFRLLYVESSNQPGADPAMFEFKMPWMNWKFAFGTEASSILFEIIEYAGIGWDEPGSYLNGVKTAAGLLEAERLKHSPAVT